MALTITPPLFELNLDPGDTWSSSIKVVNTNEGSIPVESSIMGFEASDDLGHGQFIDPSNFAGDDDSLTNWITVPGAPVVIPPGSSGEIPFSIVVPPTASPGGHYAAILIGTGSAGTSTEGSHIGVSSFISALIFVSISGNVIEQGNITSFSTDKNYYEDPDVDLSLNFANTGNVHVRPVGEIDIYNAWGKQRGTIPVNSAGGFGYVLPSSSRTFSFEWQGTPSLFDIGPYTAVVTLAYGDNNSKSVSQTVTFWILPLKKLFLVIFGTLFFLIIFFVAIRRYVRRALSLEIAKYGPVPPKPLIRTLEAPVAQGVIDLRKAYASAETKEGFDWGRYFRSLKKYSIAILLFIFVLLGIVWMSIYIKELFGKGKGFEAKTDQANEATPGSF